MRVVTALNHYFLPQYSNNQKAKLLHISSIGVIALLLLIYQLLLQAVPISGLKILGYASQISPTEVVRLTNDRRSAAGLGSLELNSTLSDAARAKGEDMLAKDYWAHIAPDGTEPWKFFLDSGYVYRYAGENLARDFMNPSSAIDAWMSSSSHKENMLSPKYREIGIAVVEGDLGGVDTTIIVQLFGTRAGEVAPQVAIAEEESSAIAVTIPEIENESATPVPVQESINTPAPVSTEEFIAVLASPTPAGQQALVAGLPEYTEESVEPDVTKVLVSPFNTTKGVSVSVVVLLLVVLVLDGLFVSRRRIARIGGRTFAHLAFLGMILAVAILLQSGEIL